MNPSFPPTASIRRLGFLGLLALPGVACATSAPSAKPPHGFHGHHGAHRFQNAEEWAKAFDDPARDEWQKPDAVVGGLALAEDAVVADIGSGTGYFAVRLARAVPRGKVFGVDVEEDMARYLRARAQREGLANLVSLLSPTDDPKLPEAVDLALVVNTVHHIEQRTAYFGKLRASLKPGGRVVIVDFKMGPIPVGPPEAMRLTPTQVSADLKEAGLVPVALDEATLPHQYIATYAVAP
ncbi:MAG: class I SAM-dependent methyltransferase [Deltaproteobacteria bacterium]|nr:class I SAM-dependent methyltransferase [Deltaproteobacteria bacterium]